MADNQAEMHAVLLTCGVTVEAIRATIIAGEGFTSVADFGFLEGDSDVTEMAKRLAARTIAEGRVNLGTVTIKRIQALVYWVKDRMKRGLDITAADFTAESMAEAGRMKIVRKELKDKSQPDVKDLGKFDPDFFESFEDAFVNLLAQCIGVMSEPLRYIVRDATPPATFETNEIERMYQLPLAGEAYDLDNAAVFRKLKAFLIDGPGWAWIEPFDSTEDGRGAYNAWCDHYNGQGELSKRTAMAKAKLHALFYKNEKSMPFERYSEQLNRIFQVLAKDPDESYSTRQQVEKLQQGIRTEDPELRSAKVIISNQFANDFVGACAFFSKEVARIHGPAQLENRREKDRKRRISSVQTDSQGRGGGRGRFGGRGGRGRGRGGRFGGRGGRGGQGGRGQTTINGVDVTDPTRAFTNDEWEALSYNGGRAYVAQARERMNRGSTNSHGRGGNEGRGRGISAATTETPNDEATQMSEMTNTTAGRGGRGGTNGRGFGRGVYQGSRA